MNDKKEHWLSLNAKMFAEGLSEFLEDSEPEDPLQIPSKIYDKAVKMGLININDPKYTRIEE